MLALLLVGALPLVAATTLQKRVVQVQATCGVDYPWSTNSKNESPCQVAAKLDAICNNGNWVLQALNASFSYRNPAGGEASFCTCSWASYNLISACTVCQGFAQSVSFWGAYSVGCAGKLSNEYFPKNITLTNDIAIPYWATTNPAEWTDGKFNFVAAKNISEKGIPDVTATSTTPGPAKKKSTPVGAIVGGVIGGLLVIAGTLFVIWYLRRKKTVQTEKKLGHGRSDSGATNGTLPYSTLGSSMPLMSQAPPTPTVRTRADSNATSNPYYNSAAATTSPPTLPRELGSSPAPVSREEVIVPFTLAPASTPDPDRKHPNGPGSYPIYDSPSAPPFNAVRMDVTPSTPHARTRYNPPTYNESLAAGGSTPGAAPPRSLRPESEAGESTSSGGRPTQFNASASDITNPSSPTRPGHSHTLSYGRSVATSPDEKRRPPDSEGGFDPRDIA